MKLSTSKPKHIFTKKEMETVVKITVFVYIQTSLKNKEIYKGSFRKSLYVGSNSTLIHFQSAPTLEHLKMLYSLISLLKAKIFLNS